MKCKIYFTIAMIFYLSSGLVSAWTENTYLAIVSDSVRLMPENLRMILMKYQEELLKGVMTGVPAHSNLSELIEYIEKESSAGIGSIKTQKNYRQAVCSLGKIARTIAFMNLPLNRQDQPASLHWLTDYDIFLEKNRENFRIRWPGIEKRPFSSKQLRQLLLDCSTRRNQGANLLKETFQKDQIPIGSYDVRSIPFGVGSISYSNAVSNTALSWLFIWDHVGGLKKTARKQ